MARRKFALFLCSLGRGAGGCGRSGVYYLFPVQGVVLVSELWCGRRRVVAVIAFCFLYRCQGDDIVSIIARKDHTQHVTHNTILGTKM